MSLGLAATAFAENNITNIITGATNAGGFYIVGVSGTNNYLEIRGNGRLTNGIGVIGSAISASNNNAVVTGSSARWINITDFDDNEVYVGSNSPGNRLTITTGAYVSADYGYVGYAISSVNNRVLVTGNNSRWDLVDELTIGVGGAGNQLIITNGGRVGCESDCVIGFGAVTGFETLASNNTAVVTGSGSVWTNEGDLYVGYQSSGNQLTITNGGRATNYYAFIGDSDSASNAVLVTGANSVWSSLGDSLILGGQGSPNNLLVVSNGGTVSTLEVRMGDSDVARNNQAVVTGNNSRWNAAGDLSVGLYGPQNLLTIRDAGQVGNFNAVVGSYPGANSNAVVVAGTGSRWTNLGDLYVGREGRANWLAISGTGQVTSVNGFIGGETNGANNWVLVADPGSLWSNSAAVAIGFYDGGNSLIVSNGGRATCTFARVGIFGSNNLALITGANSQWLVGGDLYVGQVGPGNALRIEAGGLVTNLIGYVGAAGTNSFALVTGGGAQWKNRELFIGYENITTNEDGEVTVPGGNLLTVQNNATVQATNLVVGHGAPNNQLLIRSSALVQATNLVVGLGLNSTNNLLSVWDASLIVTNAAANAQVDVRRGTLSVSNATVRTSTLLLSTNAVLAGVGTVTATSVTNSGKITPGLSVGRLTLSGNLTLQNSSSLGFDLGGYTSGVSHDSLVVSNAARLGGTLAVRLINGFESTITNGASFTLMTAGSFSGAFANVANGSHLMTEDGSTDFLVTYTGNSLILGQAKVLNSGGDSDGDGVNNAQEVLAGTDPHNSNSVFRIIAVTRQANDLRVTWTTVAGKRYVLQATTGTTGSFTNSFSDISPVVFAAGVGESTTNFVDLGAFPNRPGRYYRVKLVTDNFDTDGDGVSNEQEALAGTDPFNASSYLHITAVTRQSNNLRVTWTTVGGKQYVLQATTGTNASFTNNFSDLSPVLVATGVGESTTNFVDVGVFANRLSRYYRVKLVP